MILVSNRIGLKNINKRYYYWEMMMMTYTPQFNKWYIYIYLYKLIWSQKEIIIMELWKYLKSGKGWCWHFEKSGQGCRFWHASKKCGEIETILTRNFNDTLHMLICFCNNRPGEVGLLVKELAHFNHKNGLQQNTKPRD